MVEDSIMSSDISIYDVWNNTKRFIFITCALLTLCLGLASGQVSSQELDVANTINLIPLP